MNQNLHQCVGKTFDRYYYISTYNNTFNYISMCASAALIIITSFTMPLTTLLCVLVQQYVLQPHLQYI